MFDAGLLDVCLLGLWGASQAVCWLVNHTDAAGEAVDTLGATLTDGRVSAGCCL